MANNITTKSLNQNKMKAILSKEAGGYDLYTIDKDGKRVTFASTQDYKQKLSLKNCQAIECGYDLDELVEGFIEKTGYHDFDSYSYKLGFQKALEILGDRKFSEKDVRKAIEFGMKSYHSWKNRNEDVFIQSLQQNKWDVEVVEQCLDPNCDGINRKGDCVTTGKPKLDVDGCLILKRINL